ncbi:MAG: enoyl-CoA hydratase/isomerase family protein [Pseudonocardia sp.]|uniref:enoyl-CoA hydratase/isomerase family protein n=1 Tax=unclassified Pseudonocardia TaxID=2619320 RepID=UPI00086A46B5|nr:MULTISPECIES: enoyl-CoA hydratase-related protein [unclassified Pseudonocardia]MBN9107488.1 enoyl-CoA hydratase/isomerase family protein [Pseudonocardia sp.]ODU18103.1 MAG: enoyl-CoA hydratase [Pseudonocardia sp. SCN 72-51]ODV08348.1 MAG: enoyl-CoA hydratase [Pseudonocardia sp. SCN 73-27]
MTARVDYETLFTEHVADGVVLLTLNRPDRANGVVPELARDMVEALTALEADLSVRALVLTGAGKQFCAGADLKEMNRYLAEDMPRTGEPYNARVIFPVIERVVGSRLPVIAAVNGGAAAGGFDLALACDIRVASTAAKFGETYIRLGLPPGNGGTWFLPRLVGPGLAAELALTGDVIDAARALQIGLVNRVVEPEALIDDAVGTASRIAAWSWRAVQMTKQSLRAAWQQDLAASLATNYWAAVGLQAGPDVKEGVAAFVEKRPARFNQQDAR